MTDATAGLPLSGIRVLDFSHAAAGPYATMLLSDLGAEVIKIEKPGRGDGARHMGEPMLGPLESDYYVSINRNKLDLLLDLGTPEGVETALELAEKCDVVVQNFRPGVMDRLGLGFEAMAKRRPGIIYASISAFGDEGPMSKRPANDIIMQSVSGLMGVTGEFGGGPVRVGAPLSDYTTGLFALSGVLAALYARESHPEGQHVKVAMIDASVALLANYIPTVLSMGKRIPRLGRAHAQIVPYQAFECSDGHYVMVGAFTQGFWIRFAEAVGHAEWVEDERFKLNSDRLANRDQLLPPLEAIFRGKTREEWLEILDKADVPCSPVLELNETLELEQVAVNGTVLPIEEGDEKTYTVQIPVRSEAWGLRTPTMPPRMGRDSLHVLKNIMGKSDEEIEALLASRITDTVETGSKKHKP